MNKESLKDYRALSWRKKKEEIFLRDYYTCQYCHRSVSEGVILQVHHRCYINNCHAWEYPNCVLITICKGCHAAKHGIIPPKTGWTYEEEYDTEDYGAEQCELCGRDLRYVHVLRHPDWGFIMVGCECANNLLNNTIASDKEKERKERAEKWKRYMDSPKWKSRKNGYFYKNNEGKIIIWNNRGKYKLCYQLYDNNEDIDYYPIRENGTYSSLLEAKEKGFDILYPDEQKNSGSFSNSSLISLPQNVQEKKLLLSRIIIEDIRRSKHILLPQYKGIREKEIIVDNVLYNGSNHLVEHDFSAVLKGKNGLDYYFYYRLIFEDILSEEEIESIIKSNTQYITIDFRDIFSRSRITLSEITQKLYSFNSYSWINSPVYEECLKKRTQ